MAKRLVETEKSQPSRKTIGSFLYSFSDSTARLLDPLKKYMDWQTTLEPGTQHYVIDDTKVNSVCNHKRCLVHFFH